MSSPVETEERIDNEENESGSISGLEKLTNLTATSVDEDSPTGLRFKKHKLFGWYRSSQTESTYLAHTALPLLTLTVTCAVLAAWFGFSALLYHLELREREMVWPAVLYIILSLCLLAIGVVNYLIGFQFVAEHGAKRGVELSARYSEYFSLATCLAASLGVLSTYPEESLCVAQNDVGTSRHTFCTCRLHISVMLVQVLPVVLVRVRWFLVVPVQVLAFVCLFLPRAAFQPDTTLQFGLKFLAHGVFTLCTALAVRVNEKYRRRRFELYVRMRKENMALLDHKASLEMTMESLLPGDVVTRLSNNLPVIDSREACAVSILQITDFELWSITCLPSVALQTVDSLFCLYDNAPQAVGLETIKVLADTYVVSSGLRGNRCNPSQIVDFGLWQQRSLENLRRITNLLLHVQIGISYGPCLGAMTGSRKLEYEVAGKAFDGAQKLARRASRDEVLICNELQKFVRTIFALGKKKVPDLGEVATVKWKRRASAGHAPTKSKGTEGDVLAEEGETLLQTRIEFLKSQIKVPSPRIKKSKESEEGTEVTTLDYYEFVVLVERNKAKLEFLFFFVLCGLLGVFAAAQESSTHAGAALLSVALFVGGVRAFLLFGFSPQKFLLLRTLLFPLSVAFLLLSVGLTKKDSLVVGDPNYIFVFLSLSIIYGQVLLREWNVLYFLALFATSILLMVSRNGSANVLAFTTEGAVAVAAFIVGEIFSVNERKDNFEDYKKLGQFVQDIHEAIQLQEILLGMLIPPFAVDNAVNRGRGINTRCITNMLEDVSVGELLLPVGESPSYECLERRSQAVDAAIADYGFDSIAKLHTLGDCVVIGGPLQNVSPAKQNLRESAVEMRWARTANDSSNTVNASLALLRIVRRLWSGEVNCSAVLAIGEGFGAVLGGKSPVFDIVGWVTRSASVLAAAAPPNFIGVTEQFQRYLESAFPYQEVFKSEGFSTHDKQLWRLRGAGVVAVVPLECHPVA